MKKTSRKSDLIPIILGVLVIAAIIGAVLFFANQSKEPVKKDRVLAADDGQLKDYENEGTITLGDYSDVSKLATKDDLSSENSDDPKGTLWDAYLETCKISSYPKELLDDAIEDQDVQAAGFAEANGMTVEELAEAYGMDDEANKDVAKDAVKGRLVAKTIAFREKLTLTDDAYKKMLVEEMGNEDEKNPDLQTLEKDYIETTSTRPKDDAYVTLVQEFLMERWNSSQK